MNEKRNFDYKRLHPFKWYILENFPFLEDSIDVLTNYQLFCKLGEMYNKEVDAINTLGIQVEGLTDWFDNLDVQDEVNNKLDAMAESGELEEIMASYLNSKAIFGFDNVASMKTSENLIDGSYAKTLGYYNVSDGGKALYKIREVTNQDVVDEKFLIALSDTNLVAELIVPSEVYPEIVGAKGDGITDDTEAIQKAIECANSKNSVLCFRNNKTYVTTSTLNIYPFMEINGNNATILNETNHNIISSEDTINNIYIHDLNITGADNVNYTDNIGINLVAYYSKFKNLFISKCYSGIYIHHDGATGTLVENRIENSRINRYYMYGIFLGANGNNKITDGFLNNIICNGHPDTTLNSVGIQIGSSAGWNINSIHIYGKNYNALSCSNSYNTNLSNIYIEDFSNYGLAMGSTQTGANISNVNIIHNDTTNTGTAIRIEPSTYLPAATHIGNLTNIRIIRGSSTQGKSITCTGGVAFNGSNVIIDGLSRTLLNDCSGINFTMSGMVDTNELVITKQKNGSAYSGIKSYKYQPISPSTTSITIALPTYTQNNQSSIIELSGVGGKYTSQSGLFYKGMIQVVRNNSATLVTRIRDIDNTLFTTDPSVSINANDNTLTITFAVASDTYGLLFYDIYFPNL